MATFERVYEKNVQDWVSVNTLSSVTIGEAFVLQNNHVKTVLVSESSDKPALDDTKYLKLYNINYGVLSVLSIAEGSVQIWVRPEELGDDLNISVQG